MLYVIKSIPLTLIVLLLVQFSIAQAPDASAVSVDTYHFNRAMSADRVKMEPGTAPGTYGFATALPIGLDAVGLNNLGVHYARERQFETAIGLLKRAVESDPEFRSAYMNLGNVFDQLERPQEALNYVERAIELQPDEATARLKKCELLLFLSRDRESVTCYRDIPEGIKLDDVALVNFGIALQHVGEYKDSLQLLEKLVPRLPYNANLQNSIGINYYKIKRYKEAVDAFNTALNLAPDEPEIRFNLGLAQLAARDKPAALSQYRMLEENNPDLAERLYRRIYADKLVFVDSISP